MNFSTLTQIYDKLESVIERLPAALQKPILTEIKPIRSIFLSQRPPRIGLVGGSPVSAQRVVNALFGAEAGCARPDTFGWRECSVPGRGALCLLDLRESSISGAEMPDVILFASTASSPDDMHPAAFERAVEALGGDASVIGLVIHEPGEIADTARQQLDAALRSHAVLGPRLAGTVTACARARFNPNGFIDEARDDRDGIDRLAQLITDELPDSAKLEMARLSGVRAVQMQMAQTLIKSVSAICAAIGAQPIPLADMPILTGLQAGMVGGIIYISGQPARPKLVAQFIGAMGANYGAALVLREGSRAALKFLPLWGNAVSGAIAGAGTYAIGRSAAAHFIEGATEKQAREMFKRFRRKKAPELPAGK